MARHQTRRRNVGPVPRRAGLVVPAVAFLAVTLALAACNLSNPTGPNTGLTGTEDNEDFTFNGTITLSSTAATLKADDVSTVTVMAEVRNASGSPVQNLTPVVFSTDRGQLMAQEGAAGARTVQAVTFNGRASASFASLDRLTGTANISATVADVTQTFQVELEVAPVNGFVDLTFAGAGTVLDGTVSPITPFRTPLQAVASDTDGGALAGVIVRFRIVEDDSTGSGRGGARFVGFAETRTNTAGEATNQLVVFGVGRVILEADLIDPSNGEVVSTSNQIILVTTEPENAGQTLISLTVGSGAVTQTDTAPFAAPLTATVERDGEPVVGAIVRFTLRTPVDADGTLANTGTSQTDASGQAANVLNVADTATVGDSWAVFAEVVDSTGTVIATSNDVIVTAGSS